MKIGIAKGRIEEEVIKYLEDKNITKIKRENRKLTVNDKNNTYYFMRSIDILKLVNDKVLDKGYIGSDIYDEYKDKYSNTCIIDNLDNNKCKFVFATKDNIELNDIKSVATSYPNILASTIDTNNINIINLSGSTEIGPLLNISDAIFDITETGNTIKENGLKIIKECNYINTILIINKKEGI